MRFHSLIPRPYSAFTVACHKLHVCAYIDLTIFTCVGCISWQRSSRLWVYLLAVSAFSPVELLYGGFWEHEHHTSTPSHPSPPSQGHAHHTASRHHTFALTFVLEATREQFSELSACVEAIKSVWPDPNSGRLSFMKHFFYEVREKTM